MNSEQWHKMEVAS